MSEGRVCVCVCVRVRERERERRNWDAKISVTFLRSVEIWISFDNFMRSVAVIAHLGARKSELVGLLEVVGRAEVDRDEADVRRQQEEADGWGREGDKSWLTERR